MTGRKECKGLELSTLSKVLLLILPLVVAVLALCIGRLGISPAEVIRSIFGKITGNADLESKNELVLWNIRMPRIILAALVGAGLSVSGCTFQSLFSNPLATPDTVGVSSGTCFGAAGGGFFLCGAWLGAAVAIFFGADFIVTQAVAFLFGIIAVLLTYLAGSGKGKSLNSVVLAGIMIGSLFSALVSFIKSVADVNSVLPVITFWLMGSFAGAGYRSLMLGAPVMLVGMAVLYVIRWRLNILTLPDDEAKATGTDIKALRAVSVICATAITASCVSMCGQVGWVGLLVPHMCRMKFGNNHVSLLPACISMGMTFMIIVDTVARSATAAEIPISVLTAVIGAPFFIILMRKTGGWQL